MKQTPITAVGQVHIANVDDMTETLLWFHDLLPEAAREELAFEQARGSLLHPVTLVDKRKSNDIDSVKPFGSIAYLEDTGPLNEAIAAAEAYVQSIAPRETGFYRDALQWFQNGRAVGIPDAKRVGVRGNVELVDLAPYASLVEIDVPTGVIFGAYHQLKRMFGDSLSIGFSYALPIKYGGLIERPGSKPSRVPYMIPVLGIGNPASTVKPGIARSGPGHSLRRGRSPFRFRGKLQRVGNKYRRRSPS